MKPIKWKDLLTEDVGGQIDRRQYQTDIKAVAAAIVSLNASLLALEAGNYHPDKPHAQTVITSLRERIRGLKKTFEDVYMDKYYNK